MHMPPEVWGPIFWATLHIVALGYADVPQYAEKRAAKEFFQSMAFLLPCPVCRIHFNEILRQMPIENWLDNRTTLMEWVWKAHNIVNQRLGKEEISLQEFHNRYKTMAEYKIPVPPSSSSEQTAKEVRENAYIQGAVHTVLGLSAVCIVGSLLWFSYKKSE
jgi:hypothetical protein